MRVISLIVAIVLQLSVMGCAQASAKHGKKSVKHSDGHRAVGLKLVKHDGGFFSIMKPKGWKVKTAGTGSTLAFLIRDPSNSLRQIFDFSSIGPIYMSRQQKSIDLQYVNMGGYPIGWLEMPVIEPFTPSNFLKNFQLVANTRIAQTFMPGCPTLANLQIISSKKQPSFINGGTTELIRAVFTSNGKAAQGMFLVTTAPNIQYNGGPGAGNGMAFLFLGITAPKSEFAGMERDLVKSLESFTLDKSYVKRCMAASNQQFKATMRAGQTLRETSDIIYEGWERRNKTDDIIAEKRSDAILGKERLYDPDSGDVYEFDNGFYDKYKVHSNEYEMSNLQPLPNGNHDLWTKAPLDGAKHIR
ncbi:MAG: hypothetical protein ABFD49_04340 [Armatimonadota bacterium]|nr:hypothetical protein [bacterium]